MCIPLAAAPAAAGAAKTLSAFQVASLAFSAGSTLLGAYGQIQSSQAEANQLRYEAAVQNNNQILSQQQAAEARERGEIEENEHRLRIGQLKGRQKTVLASSGIETDSGTALDVLSDTAELGELESLRIRDNAEREAHGFEVQANNFSTSSQNSLLGAENVQSSGRFGAATSLIGGAGSVADRWYRYRKGF